MSRGVVLWPDQDTEATIRGIWDRLDECGIPSHAAFTHRLHRPHMSLIVAEDLPVAETLHAIGATPSLPLTLRADSAGIFPPHGTLFLGCVVDEALLAEQRRVHDAVIPLARDPWPYFRPGRWVPHITLSMSLTPAQIAVALPIVLAALPVEGAFIRGGVEDGSTGRHWPADSPCR